MTGTNREKVLNIISPELDELYIAIRDIGTATHIFTARGASLDAIGVLIDFHRNINESDEIYRDRLINIININTIVGTKDAIRKLLANFLRIDESKVIVRESTPNYIIIELPAEFESRDMDIKDVIYRSVAAGIYVGTYYSAQYWDISTWDNQDMGWS